MMTNRGDAAGKVWRTGLCSGKAYRLQRGSPIHAGPSWPDAVPRTPSAQLFISFYFNFIYVCGLGKFPKDTYPLFWPRTRLSADLSQDFDGIHSFNT